MCSRLVALVLVVLLTMALNGCSNISARAVESGGIDYNLALQSIDDKQMLLNLVRLRYRDRPYFLEAGSLTTQFSVTSSLGISGGFGTANKQNTIANTGLSLREQPTVSYRPLQGEEFAQRLLSPIEVETIVLLANSGWSMERILRLTVQHMNGLANAPTAAGPTPIHAPEYREFKKVAKALRILQQQDQLSLFIDSRDRQPYLFVSPEGKQTAAFRQLVNLLHLDEKSARYRLMLGVSAKPGKSISLQLRSLMGVMSFMSQSVETPEKDRLAGLITSTTDMQGELFDWADVVDSLITIPSQSDVPGTASVSVRYRNSWFYIDDTDLDSKSSFSLLGQLFALRVGKGGGVAPMITLPVGN